MQNRIGLGMGPRLMANQQLMQYLQPRGSGGIIPARGAIRGQSLGDEIGAGMAGLGRGLQAYAAGQRLQEQQAQQQAARDARGAYVRNQLMPNQNAALAAGGGPTRAAADILNAQSPLGLNAQSSQALMYLAESDPDTAFGMVTQLMNQPAQQFGITSLYNPETQQYRSVVNRPQNIEPLLQRGWIEADLAPKPEKPGVPGRDVPFSPEVLDQRMQLAQAGALSLPDPPSGYRYTQGGAAVEPIPGSAQEREAKEAEEQKEEARDSVRQVIRSVDSLLTHEAREMATGLSSWTTIAPGTPARDFEEQFNTLKAQTFLPMVEKMKGSGQLSDAEGARLSAAVAALELNMSEGGFARSLFQLRSDMVRALERSGADPEFIREIEEAIPYIEGISPPRTSEMMRRIEALQTPEAAQAFTDGLSAQEIDRLTPKEREALLDKIGG